jgi:hypothetical protein
MMRSRLRAAAARVRAAGGFASEKGEQGGAWIEVRLSFGMARDVVITVVLD